MACEINTYCTHILYMAEHNKYSQEADEGLGVPAKLLLLVSDGLDELTYVSECMYGCTTCCLYAFTCLSVDHLSVNMD